MRASAFSLIELMVVIAIVAILAAVAVPAYQNYLISSRLADAGTVLQGLLEESIVANESQPYGFPVTYCFNAYPNCLNPLGLGNNGNGQADDSLVASIIPYFLPSTEGGGLTLADISACGGGLLGLVTVSLDATKLGFNPSIATNSYLNPNSYGYNYQGVLLSCYAWIVNGTTYKFCDYSYGTASGSGTGSILPGWTNANTTTGNDNNNENAALWNNPAAAPVVTCN